ncbi:SMC-Scp complex subunit ScpB [Mucilaginibacter myungsuensis]|uniref:SMC-Scp complex subunit ScpB n=1 Tax=Mucilaginibacter myungsuensis TaxID=649104 RepID=A0A929KS75_9SPHI|nr:SMC-Scp complex subunit ScpB [Mucilaginibacter myungsuensis]MBE9660536.1 SMC-Scp complex subunit ScpB [Mucilaginibacter myungsuensis]MDN3600581.1 SMC-Scp complex subunit ScpB [Mucilaginibacter myungsuensis]
MSEQIEQQIEALIFASEQSIRAEEILYCLQAAFEQDFSDEDINTHIDNIKAKYSAPELAIELVKIGSGYQFLTKKTFHPIINQLQLERSKKKMSQAAIETLAIIAYKQPVTKLDVEQIRGVNSDYSIQRLLEKELIVISGKSETVGKPLLYATSPLFMDYFGINSIAELPQIKDFTDTAVSIGEAQE